MTVFDGMGSLRSLTLVDRAYPQNFLGYGTTLPRYTLPSSMYQESGQSCGGQNDITAPLIFHTDTFILALMLDSLSLQSNKLILKNAARQTLLASGSHRTLISMLIGSYYTNRWNHQLNDQAL